MSKNICEKVISEHAGRDVSEGEIVVTKIDWCFTHDASGPLVMDYIKQLRSPVDPRKCIVFMDHIIPSHNSEISNAHSNLRRFAQESGMIFYEAGNGICHQLMAEGFVSPSEMIIGADSHSCTAGALGAFATGMGATDVAVAMSLGKTWLRVPKTIRVIVNGQPGKGVFAKDVALYVIGRLGAEGANYRALEFQGSAVDSMDVDERLTLTNMAAEAGAKTALISSDEKTKNYLESMGRISKFRPVDSDPDANYESTIEMDASSISPLVAIPHSVDKLKTVDELESVNIDQVFIGSCTNGRFQDLCIAAKIIEDKRLRARLIVTPASRKVYLEAMRAGIMRVLLEAGAIVMPPSCGICYGVSGGVPADSENMLATSNRNFLGRTGNPNAFTYLCSPATAAASAIEGRISDPRSYL